MDAIIQALLKLRAGIRKALESISQAYGSRHSADEEENKKALPEPVKVIVAFDDQTIRDAKARDGAQQNTQDSIKRATWSAVVAAGAYAFISILIWCQMIKQTRTANAQLHESSESFRMDERAWVEVQPINPILRSPASNDFGASFTYNIVPKNVGKTVAYNIAFKAVRGAPMSALSLGDNADQIASYQKMLLKNTFGMPDVLISRRVSKTLGPGEVSNAPFDIYGQEPQKGLYQFLIGRVDYTDAFQVAHWKTFCLFIADSNGNLQYCQYGNDEDHNPELPSH